MKTRYAAKKTLSRAVVPLAPGPNPHLRRRAWRKQLPLAAPFPDESLSNSTSHHTRLATSLFDHPDTTVLPASSLDRFYNAVYLLFRCPNPAAPPPAPVDRSVRMKNWIQVAATPTADTPGTCLFFHFDDQRYIFGAAAEGTQRALTQRKIGLAKVENVFLSGQVNWHNTGGLLGLVLTLADMLASSKAQSLENTANKSKKKKKNREQTAVSPALNIHGGKNLAHMLATSRRFIFRKGLPLTPHEIRDDPRAAAGNASEPNWKDGNIKVWYMPIESSLHPAAGPRKRSHDEFTEAAPADTRDEQPSQQASGDDRKLVETVVTQMFNSDWSMDALVQTTLHEAKLPAKLFIRDEKGHIQPYTGPMPGSGKDVPDIPVLVRRPWPGAMVESLPRTRPSNQSMCYIVKGHERRGKFNHAIAVELGVVKTDFRFLTQGENVKGKDGMVVTPDMVLGDSIPGSGFALVDIPDRSFIEALVSRAEWSDEHIMKGVEVIYWSLGRDLVSDPRLRAFMEKMSSVRHIVSSVDTCPNMIALESVAVQAFKLRCVDPDRFPLPLFNNELSLSSTPTAATASPTYETARTGKTVQFAPQLLHEDDKIIPFPDIGKLATADIRPEVLEMAAQARDHISDPDFLAKVEKAESDIPNRDAEIISLGTGSALPSKYRNVSATLLRVPGCGNYLFDCGENTLGQMRRVFGDELPDVLRELKGIWISHLHADHHLGTASVIKAWHEETSKSDPSAQLFVASHVHMNDWLREYADVEEYGHHRIKNIVFQQYDPKKRICEPRVFSEPEIASLGLSRIDACLVSHCHGAMAVVFTFPSGLKIAYSGDCRPSPSFAEIGQGATLLIHESTFDDELQGDAIAKKHSTMSEAIGIGRQMGVRRILLTHFSQRYQKVPVFEENFEIVPDAEDSEKAKVDEVILPAFDYMRVKLGDFRKAQAFLPAMQKLFEDEEDQ
ncbi:hypothetical protein F4778DRAFT_88333 [Xylariomycetidae sp. FL2044]|nr:hypothetical protein F4778DRAFT_88333 [Xylariomycetidae sp. FL2044]